MKGVSVKWLEAVRRKRQILTADAGRSLQFSPGPDRRLFFLQTGCQPIGIPEIANVDASDPIVLMKFDWHRRESPGRRNQADESALQPMKLTEGRFANSGIRYDAALVSEAVQVIVLSMFPGVLPERAVPRQPLHQRTPAVLIQRLNGLRHRHTVHHLTVDKTAMTVQLSPEPLHDPAHAHDPANSCPERRDVGKLSMDRELIEDQLHVNRPTRRNSSCPCRTDRRSLPARCRCCPRRRASDCIPAHHRRIGVGRSEQVPVPV